MTVTENVEAKQGSNPDLSYAPLETTHDTEERASSEESVRNNNSQNQAHNNANEQNAPLVADQQRLVIVASKQADKPRASDGLQGEPTPPSVRRSKDPEAGNAGDEHVPPDGGVRAWLVMLGSFIINGVLFSVINSYSVVYSPLQKRLADAGDAEASSKAALVGSLTIGTTFFLSPVASILTEKIGIRMTTFLGGTIAAGGMLLSSMLSDKVEVLYFTYGMMYGLGASLAYTPSLVILGHYFKRYLGLVNGVVTAGSSVFTIIMPYILEALIEDFALEGMLRCMALLTTVVMGCALLFKPMHKPSVTPEPGRRRSNFKSKVKEVINVSIWKRKRYVVWASAIPLALFGYFVPYVHIGKFVETRFEGYDKKMPVICIGITSGLGRLIFGYIADMPRVNRILLQQISFISIGVLTMLLAVSSSYPLVVTISLAMGLFDGCFISLLGPIAFDICGQKGAAQAIGFLLGMCSIPLTVGPVVAGLLYDHTNDYTLPFLLAGVPPIVGAMVMFLVRCVKDDKTGDAIDDPTLQSLTHSAWQNGDTRTGPRVDPPPYSEATGRQLQTEGKELEVMHKKSDAAKTLMKEGRDAKA